MRDMRLGASNIRPRLITMFRNGFVLILVEINFRVFARKTYFAQTSVAAEATQQKFIRELK